MSFLTSILGIDPVIKAARERRWKDTLDGVCDWLENHTSGRDKTAILTFTAILRGFPVENEIKKV